MGQQPSKLPSQIRVPTLLGLNERVSVSNLRAGEFSYLEGLYPSRQGQLSRVPAKLLYATVAGIPKILQITQTFNRNGDILIQTDSGRIAYTLDELLGRSTVPNLTPGTTPGTDDEEEAMSLAIILQEEASGQSGGSAQGYLTGTDASSVANTFYGRRLTACPVNQSSAIVSFTASTGGASAVSTPGQIVLSPATYRIRAWFIFSTSANPTEGVIGLWNATTSQFQLDDGTGSTTPQPIISSPVQVDTTTGFNVVAGFTGRFVVSGSNNTFQFNQAFNSNANARDKNLCGLPNGITATVNGSAPKNRYALIEILKEPS